MHVDERVPGVGGVELYRQAWLPDGEPRAAIVLCHGASEHSGRYSWVAEQLVRRRYALHTLDHRGHGRSGGPRALIDRVDNAVADVDALVDNVTAPKRFMLGHSMGGALALAYAIRHQQKLDGLVLSAPLAALEAASPVTRAIGRTLSVVAPRAGVYTIDSTAVSRDPGVVRDYDDDPLNHHGKLPARTVSELSQAVGDFPEQVAALELPLLVLYGSDDRLVPPAGAQMVYERAGSRDKQIKRYDGLYHEILNEPEREHVLTDIADWLDAHSSPAGA